MESILRESFGDLSISVLSKIESSDFCVKQQTRMHLFLRAMQHPRDAFVFKYF